MVCSLHDALEIFLRPWAADAAELTLSLDGGNEGTEPCVIDWISPEKGTLVSIRFTLSGRNQIFNISDPSRVSFEDTRAEPVPELVRNGWSTLLLLEFPNGRSLLLAKPLDI